MLTRRAVYESHGFTCNPNYHSFDKEISEPESFELAAVLEKMKHDNSDFINELFALKKKRRGKEQWI